MIRHTDFDTTICDVELNVHASVDDDGEFDEFTVKAGDVIITDVLDDAVVEQLKEKALYEVSDENIALTRADDEYKGE